MHSGFRNAVVWLRAQRVPTSALAGFAATASALILGDVLFPVPGVPGAVPALRFLPAALAACGALVLEEAWSEFELAGAVALPVLRAGRFGSGLAVVLGGGLVVVAETGTHDVLALTLVVYAGLVVLVSMVGRWWWTGAAAGTYGQLHIRDLERLEVPMLLALVVVALAGTAYAVRGERTRDRRSPT